MMLRVDFIHFQLLLSKAEIKDFIKTQKTKKANKKTYPKDSNENKDSND